MDGTCRGRAIGQEDRDGYRLKDKNGRPIICYNCDEAASAPKHRRIVSCDFCDQHWHLDCLDPPMSGMPPPTRKWMCPLHADPLVPRRRQTKAITTQTVDRPYRPNNGDIIILPHQEARAGGEVEEMTVNRVRYQLPEQTVVLDFWNRVTGQKVSGSSSSKRSLTKARVPRKRSAGYDSGDMSSLSELTSSDESEAEATGRSSSRKAAAASSTTSGPASALDSLALLAEVRYVDLLNSQQGSSSSVINGTPGRDTKGKGPRDLPPAVPNSIQRRGPRPSAPIPAATAAAQGAKRTSIGPASGAVGNVAPAVAGTSAGTSARSRGGSPSLSPAPRSSELVVETKEDLQALMRIRKLTKAKDAEGDQWRSTLFGFLEGEPILVSPILVVPQKYMFLQLLTSLLLSRSFRAYSPNLAFSKATRRRGSDPGNSAGPEASKIRTSLKGEREEEEEEQTGRRRTPLPALRRRWPVRMLPIPWPQRPRARLPRHKLLNRARHHRTALPRYRHPRRNRRAPNPPLRARRLPQMRTCLSRCLPSGRLPRDLSRRKTSRWKSTNRRLDRKWPQRPRQRRPRPCSG